MQAHNDDVSLAACVMTDAEGYTAIAEGLDPASLVGVVNRYFRGLFSAVLANGGVVVDVKGDGILAIWAGAVADAALRERVCLACLQMLEAADRFNAASPGCRLPTRIGVDLGPVAFANVGAYARYEYRALGDPVNTCSRLEELNKTFATRLLVSAPFAEGIERFLFRDLGAFVLRGKRAPLRVLELVAEADRASLAQRRLCRDFAAALGAYERGRITEALSRFSALRARFPQDGAIRFFLQRCFAGEDDGHRGRAVVQRAPLALAAS